MTGSLVSATLLASLARHANLPSDTVIKIASMRCNTKRFRDGEVIVAAGEDASHCRLIARGMAKRVHRLTRGHRTVVVSALHVPGELADLGSFVMEPNRQDIVACGTTMVELIPHEEIEHLVKGDPAMIRVLMSLTSRDITISRQWQIAAATLNGAAHVGHLLCELNLRLSAAGEARDNRFHLPVRQRDLGDVLGYSPVHINRAVRELREAGYLEWRGQHVHLVEPDALARYARFDPSYLRVTSSETREMAA